jgi:predicted nucleic acid-binding protein
MGQRYLIDTNVIIGILNGAIPKKNALKLAKIIDTNFLVSTIVNIESLGYYSIKPDDKIRISRFLSKATTFYIDKKIQEKAIEIRQNKKMKLGDSIIAATALVHNLTIVTRNETDFWGLGLTIYNPFDEK